MVNFSTWLAEYIILSVYHCHMWNTSHLSVISSYLSITFTSLIMFQIFFLDRATSPSKRDEDWEAIMAFCDRVNKELEGPQISVRLLAHKIQSPQEREALFALAVSILLCWKHEICFNIFS